MANMSADTKIDPLFKEAARMIVVHQDGSASFLQRWFEIDNKRACRLIGQLEQAGVIGPNRGSGARDVLISYDNILSLEKIFSRLNLTDAKDNKKCSTKKEIYE